MKKILLLFILLPCLVKAQDGYHLLQYASELWNFPGDVSRGLQMNQNDLKPQYTGGIFWICDTCAAPDSITRFGRSFDSRVWKKVSEIPTPTTPAGKTGQVIRSDGSALGYANVGSLFSALTLAYVSGNLTATAVPISGSNLVSNSVSIPSLTNVGTAGTYGEVTTDAQGRVTAGKRLEKYSGTTNASEFTLPDLFTPVISVPPALWYSCVPVEEIELT